MNPCISPRRRRRPFSTCAAAAALAVAAAGALLAAGPALAKLPPLSPEAKAKADEAAAKAAWQGKVDLYKLCVAMDRVAATYRADAGKAGKPLGAVVETASCSDPGAFVYTAAAAPAKPQPLEGAGAHSPTGTAVAPPSSNAPQAPGQAVKR